MDANTFTSPVTFDHAIHEIVDHQASGFILFAIDSRDRANWLLAQKRPR